MQARAAITESREMKDKVRSAVQIVQICPDTLYLRSTDAAIAIEGITIKSTNKKKHLSVIFNKKLLFKVYLQYIIKKDTTSPQRIIALGLKLNTRNSCMSFSINPLTL